jgi:putative hydrolase of the HAD superfamily
MADRTQVLFLDAAGTLFGLAEPVGVTYTRLAAKHGVRVEAAAMDHAFRCTWKELDAPLHPEGQGAPDDDRSWWRGLVERSFEKVLEDETVEPRVFETMFAELYDHFAQGRAWHLYDDVPPALEALSGRVRLMVLSNFDRRLHGILRGLGIDGFFERVIVSSEVGAGKPHRRMFEAGLLAAGVGPRECLHAGDDEVADVGGAEAAGIPAMLIRRPEVTLMEVARRCGVEPGKNGILE